MKSSKAKEVFEEHELDQHDASKSARKRKMQAFKDAAYNMVQFKKTVIQKLPVDDNLKAALLESKQILNNNAQKRHLAFIAKLLSKYDVEVISNIIEINDPYSNISRQRIHAQERWLQYLIYEQRDAITKFIELYPEVEAQHLNQLVRNIKINEQGLPVKNTLVKLRQYLRNFFGSYAEIKPAPPASKLL